MHGRILLVEDDADCRTIYRTILEHGGFEVMEARTGPEALARAREGQPDLILMDVSIPEIDGWQAAEILKGGAATHRYPHHRPHRPRARRPPHQGRGGGL